VDSLTHILVIQVIIKLFRTQIAEYRTAQYCEPGNTIIGIVGEYSLSKKRGFSPLQPFARRIFSAIHGPHNTASRNRSDDILCLLGLGNNLVLIIVISFCALLASKEVTELAMTGWSAGIGQWAMIAGSIFTVLAMITTYWSISLALSDIVEEQLKWNKRLCWILATVPSLALALLNIGGFLAFLELAGGAIAIIVAVLVVPTFRNARKELPGSMLGPFAGDAAQLAVVIAYLLMAVGNLVSL